MPDMPDIPVASPPHAAVQQIATQLAAIAALRRNEGGLSRSTS